MSSRKTYEIKKEPNYKRLAENRIIHIKVLVDVIGKLGFYPHAHDGYCKKCKYPETTMVRDGKTNNLILEYCSKCGWSKKYL